MAIRRKVDIAIHDLHPRGGHERSMLEIARRLARVMEVRAFSYVCELPEVPRLPVWPRKLWPVLAKVTWYYLASLVYALGRGRRGERPLVLATGACSLVSDWVQVQFVNTAWRAETRKLPREPGWRGVYHRFMTAYHSLVERGVYRRDKRYVAISRGIGLELQMCFGIPAGQITVIHHGVDSGEFRPASASGSLEQDRARLRAELGIPKDELVLGFVGAFGRKNLTTVVDALARLPEAERARASVLAVGAGDHAGIRAQAARLGVSERVRLVGPRPDIPRYFRAMDAFVFPTLYEPFGLVILEAMASGLVPIVSRSAGASELVQGDESGILLDDPLDAVRLSEEIGRLARDPGLRANLAEGALRVARARSWDQVASEYVTALEGAKR